MLKTITQKPVKLIEYLIKTYKNDEYYKILTDRINSHTVQNVLF